MVKYNLAARKKFRLMFNSCELYVMNTDAIKGLHKVKIESSEFLEICFNKNKILVGK